jgi:DNA-binding NtrC family response regulator
MMRHVTVVDDGPFVAPTAREVLLRQGVKVTFASSLQELPLVVDANGSPDLLVLSLAPEVTGWEVVGRLNRVPYRGPLLLLLDTLDRPGLEYLTGIFRVECVIRSGSAGCLEEALLRFVRGERAPVRNGGPIPAVDAYHGIVAQSEQMREIFGRIEKLASSDGNVCIYGESGTGKELIARAIHYASPRRNEPLITLDCTTIPEGLMDSQLLGHVRGAFTGAVENRDGVFSLAHGGTLFVDEITELSPPLQAKLLRVVQTREFTRVGGTRPLRTDVRLVTATNRDPRSEVDLGRFRADLYYRIAVFMIKVPPLRERREDIPLLARHFLTRFSAQYEKPPLVIDPCAMKQLMALPWPGNVRQLENFLEQAVVFAESNILTVRDLFAGDRYPHSPYGDVPVEQGLPRREVERRHILDTLRKVRGNRTEAARLLGISVRGLQYKLKAYGSSEKSGTDLGS